MARSDCDQVALLETRALLLTEIIKEPERFLSDKILLTALKSQSGLARLELFDPIISPLSLNSLKKYASYHLQGGFTSLDMKRVEALERLQRCADELAGAAKKGTKRSLAAELQVAKADRQQLREELLLLTMCLKRSLDLLQHYVDANGSTAERVRCKKERSEILSCFSHSRVAAQKLDLMTNVIQL